MMRARKFTPGSVSLLIAAFGVWAVGAQMLVFRAFAESFELNELAVAVFFAAWLGWVAVGAALARKCPWPSPASFSTAALAYVPALVLQIWTMMQARRFAGVPSQEILPVLRMLAVAIPANAPVSLVTGWLFTAACRIIPHEGGLSPARVYSIEALGSMIGGVGGTLALALGFSDEQVALGLIAILAPAAAWASPRRRQRLAIALVGIAAVIVLVSAAGHLTRLRDRLIWSQYLPADEFQGRIITPRGVYRYGYRAGALVVQSSGSIVENVGSGEAAATVVAVHMGAVPTARRVLVAGPGTYQLALLFLRLPGIEHVAWAPPDPAYGQCLVKVAADAWRPDPVRFTVLPRDVRGWLTTTNARFDLIVVQYSDPLTLSLQRFFSVEFFELLQQHLEEGGVASVRFSGGANYLGPEAARLGASIVATAQRVFRHVLLQPGDSSRLLCTDRLSGFPAPSILARRFAALNGADRVGPPELVLDAFPSRRAESQMAQYAKVRETVAPDRLILRDNVPTAVSYALALELKQANAAQWARTWPYLPRPTTVALEAGLLALIVIRLSVHWRRRTSGVQCAQYGRFDAFLWVTGIGIANMIASVWVLCVWQLYHGDLFLFVGLLSALFMGGLWAGARLVHVWASRLPELPTTSGRFRWALLGVLVFHLAILALLALSLGPKVQSWHRVAVALLAGIAGGAHIPLVTRQLSVSMSDSGRVGAWLEMLDHLGGTLGALGFGLFLLPALGLTRVWRPLALAVGCAIPSLFARPSAEEGDVWDRAARIIGLILGWLAVVWVVGAAEWRIQRALDAADSLAQAARELVQGQPTEAITLPGYRGHSVRVYVAPNAAAPQQFVFSTADFSEPVLGYAGPIELAVCLDTEGKLQGVRVLRSRETPRYFERLRPWLDALVGWRIGSGDRPPVDAVTGATVSSTAILELLRNSGRQWAAATGGTLHAVATARSLRLPTRLVMGLLIALGGALWLRTRSLRRIARLAWLAAVVLWFGRIENLQLSVAHLRPWVELHRPTMAASLSFLLPFGIPLLVFLVGNVYCGWVCPFGALQELAAEVWPARWRLVIPPQVYRWGRWLKFAVLALVVVALRARPDATVENLDPLALVFSGNVPPATAWWIVGLVLASLWVPRFWCRTLCPVGAALSVASAARPFAGAWPRVRPRCCDLGVRRPLDLDCLVCDRCRLETARPRPEHAPWHHAVLFGAMVAVVLASWGILAAHEAATWTLPTLPESQAESLRSSGAAIEPAAMRKIRERQRAGTLSDREALHYSPLESDPTTSAERSRHRYRGGR
jgi:predicted membrane-bound spermidine synthase